MRQPLRLRIIDRLHLWRWWPIRSPDAECPHEVPLDVWCEICQGEPF